MDIETKALIKDARRLNNQTMRDTGEMDELHRRMDRWIAQHCVDGTPEERWDAPFRVEHRAFVKSLFRRD